MNMIRTVTSVLLILLLLPAAATAQQTITKTEIDGDEVWTADNVYVLDGFVRVEDGETLTIEPGTVVKGRAGDGANASALIVMRGAKIFAEGTPQQPIIFTAEADDVSDPYDLLPTQRGLWGGVAILGKATLNTADPVQSVEGVPVALGALYGCNRDEDQPEEPACDDADDSGAFRYVSIRHSGTALEGGNEIQGLTVAGVGSGTTIEYVESFASADDGFEFFGGTVDTRYLVSAFNDDDAFDYDQGWRGNNQFWFVIQGDDTGDRAGEFDGGDDPDETGEPYATPTIYNATLIGSGLNPSSTKDNDALTFRANAGGMLYNSVVTEFKGGALTVEDLEETEADSRGQLEAGRLALGSNVFARLGAGTGSAATALSALVEQDFARTAFEDGGNQYAGDTEVIRSTAREIGGFALDPRPVSGSLPLTIELADYPDDAFWRPVSYAGAFGTSGDIWIRDWTAIAQLGYLDSRALPAEPVADAEIPASITLGQNYPNPFNPSTTIEFGVDQAQHVRLSVYDVMGREVAVLADKTYPAGTYRAGFDASGLASGVYVYRIETETAAITKTMTLVK